MRNSLRHEDEHRISPLSPERLRVLVKINHNMEEEQRW